MHNDTGITTNSFTADYAFFISECVSYQYRKFLGKNLTSQNLIHFNNAINHQKNAINEFKHSENILEYIYFMDKAYYEYKQINI